MYKYNQKNGNRSTTYNLISLLSTLGEST